MNKNVVSVNVVDQIFAMIKTVLDDNLWYRV